MIEEDEHIHVVDWPNTRTAHQSKAWESAALEKILLASVEEQRRSRRWGIFFKSLVAIYVLMLAGIATLPRLGQFQGSPGPHTAVITIKGEIAEGGKANADDIIQGLREAAVAPNVKGIVLRMNTPGGSPVQSDYVYHEIRRIKSKNPSLPIYAVVEDLCASGGYYIASAADKIYVNNASIVGSIGVIMSGFGFVEAMDKLGVERRVMTAGTHKAMMDPFTPVDEQAKSHLKSLLGEVHQQFIDAVKQGRGDRLKQNPVLFTGLVWTGADSVRLGLADDIGDVRHVAESVIGAKQLVNYSVGESFIERITQSVGTSFGHAMFEEIHGLGLR